MKLELKHLAGYLPYGLKVRVENYKCDYVGREFDEVIGFHQWDKSGLLWSALTEGGAKPSVDKVKPILRPLLDLTKEIEVNGEKFVPKDIIEELHSSECIRWILCNDIYECKYHVIEKLLEWHFDIYGLIENNLAIDKKTIS